MLRSERFRATTADLHELACTGPTPKDGCVCRRANGSVRPMRATHIGVVERHDLAATRHRVRADELVDGIEALVSKLAEIPVVPLDTLDRFERLIVKAHTANLIRLPSYAAKDYEDAR